MTNATDQFIHYLNIKNYTAQLADAGVGGQRDMLLRLLADELAHARHMGWQPSPGSLETRRLYGLD